MVPILSEGGKTGADPGLGIPESPNQSPNPIQREVVATPDKERTLDLKTAEEKLWKNNLLLLASRFNIDARKAGIEQAGLYANPNIFIDQSIYAEPTQRYFDFTRSGQTVVQIQQLFLLGGKIGKRVRVAELNARMGEQEFYDLARELVTKLRKLFYAISTTIDKRFPFTIRVWKPWEERLLPRKWVIKEGRFFKRKYFV
ncbi:outer membrane efflux protein [Leptospira borgpetersenii str. Brem 307]|nr:outer membrane efflux protein [Leptospira borgpetersenii str. Brem 307]